jgi:hypothetical protein
MAAAPERPRRTSRDSLVCRLQIVESALRVLVTKMGAVQAVAQELPGGRV